jgi:hypothetical protein
MTAFSASDAALEGFFLIHRRWRTVLGWAGFNLLALVMLVVVTVVLSLVASAMSGGANEPVAVLAGTIAALGGLAIQAIIAGGVFRLELRPEEPAFMHLRLGADELRLLAVWLITLTGAWVAIWAGTAVAGLAHIPGPWVGVVVAALLIYLAVRFCLAAPIAFAERRIQFPRSWRLTRGRVLALLGMSVMSFCLIALVMVTVMVVLALVAAGSAGLDGLAGLFGGAESLQRHPGLYVLEFAVEIVLTPVLWVLGVTPVIAAYRALVGAADA